MNSIVLCALIKEPQQYSLSRWQTDINARLTHTHTCTHLFTHVHFISWASSISRMPPTCTVMSRNHTHARTCCRRTHTFQCHGYREVDPVSMVTKMGSVASCQSLDTPMSHWDEAMERDAEVGWRWEDVDRRVWGRSDDQRWRGQNERDSEKKGGRMEAGLKANIDRNWYTATGMDILYEWRKRYTFDGVWKCVRDTACSLVNEHSLVHPNFWP